MDEKLKIVVIDAGHSQMRVGYAGDDKPECAFPNVAGAADQSTGVEDRLYGLDALKNCENLVYPFKEGSLHDFELMEEILLNTFGSVLCVDQSEVAGVMVADAHFEPEKRKIQERLAQIMFETFGVKKLCLADRYRM